MPHRQRSREEIKTLPLFAGLGPAQITLVTTPEAAERACARLAACTVLGFDTESRPTFHKGQTSDGPHLVQLASDDHCWLFPVAGGVAPAGLKAILESSERLLVGFELGSDRSRLESRLGIRCGALLELGGCFRSEDPRITVGAVQAVARLFGQYFRKSKRHSTSNWASRTLSEGQQVYAANDAWVALRVYRELERRGMLQS